MENGAIFTRLRCCGCWLRWAGSSDLQSYERAIARLGPAEWDYGDAKVRGIQGALDSLCSADTKIIKELQARIAALEADNADLATLLAAERDAREEWRRRWVASEERCAALVAAAEARRIADGEAMEESLTFPAAALRYSQ